jgi:hypothetical protein
MNQSNPLIFDPSRTVGITGDSVPHLNSPKITSIQRYINEHKYAQPM